MFTIKNVIKNIYRYKNKYILFGVLYLIVILTASVCVNIFMQMGQVTDNILREYAGVVKFNGRVSHDFDDVKPRFTKDDFLQYINMEHIYDIRLFRYNFIAISDTNILRENVSELKRELYIDGEIIPIGFPLMPVFVFGYNMSLLHLETDGFELEKGRMFEKTDEVVIAKNKVKGDFESQFGGKSWQDLDLGDKIIIKNDDGIYKEFTVVGIKKQNPNDDINTNRCIIYTTFESAEYFENIVGEKVIGYAIDTDSRGGNGEIIYPGYDALIYLDSPDNYWDLRSKMINMGVWIEPLFPNFRALINLTQNMQSWSMLFMILTGLIIIFVTIISTVILLNSRKYEIAVLRSAGMKKIRLIANYLIENLAFIWGISIISLITTQFIAPIFTSSIFTGMQDLISVEMYANLTQSANLELIFQTIGIIFGGTTAVVMLSLILVCINILKFEPLKIFNKQY
ncbi:MAG: ABC transporter permease [Firmicutes bacterium]|nr:ABC transporter permease [Bacillota bacterium]